jgi:negative regulator of flagellin synthesis FlgM
MNIHDVYTKTSPVDAAQGVKPVRSTSQVRETRKVDENRPPRGDKVQISDRAREMQAALEQIKKLPDVDEDKVAGIKAQVESGTYKPNNTQIAEKMLSESFLGSGETK